jgi:hypothetical protein
VLIEAGVIAKLPEAERAAAAEKIYADTAGKLYDGFTKVMERYAKSGDEREKAIAGVWSQ